MNTALQSDEELSLSLQKYLEETFQDKKDTSLKINDFLHALYLLKDITLDFNYLLRLAQIGYERHLGIINGYEPPYLIIKKNAINKNEVLGDLLNFVIVFGAETIHFQDTISAITLDSLRCGEIVNVLGARIEWISNDFRHINRALLVDETGIVKETAFNQLVPINVVQILHLPLEHEIYLHKQLSKRFHYADIYQINPYENAAERADDKSYTHKLLYRHNITSPDHIIVPRNATSQFIISILKRFNKNPLIVLPNKGTEGQKVEKFDLPKEITENTAIIKYLQDEILPYDDAIIREMRGNVRYFNGSEYLNIAFRINVFWNGIKFIAESGYAQLAKDESTFPASRGRGGSIIDINKAFGNLYYLMNGNWKKLMLSKEDIDKIRSSAENSAFAVNEELEAKNFLKAMGIDIILEVEEEIVPIVLEINPRPAGMSFSSEITGISEQPSNLVVSTELFKIFHKQKSPCFKGF